MCHRPAWMPARVLLLYKYGRVHPGTTGTGARQQHRRGRALLFRMSPKAATLVLVLLAVAGSRADVSADQVASVIWKYFMELGTNAKDTVDQLQQAELTKQLNTLLQSNLETVNSYATDLQRRLVPFATELQARLAQDSQRLKEQIQGELAELQAKLSPYADEVHQQIGTELESLRVKLSPYVDEVHHKVGKHLEDLRFQLQPFTEELLDQVSLKARELQHHLLPSRDVTAQLLEGVDEVQRFMAHYADKIAFHTDQVKDIFHPYADRLLSEIHRNMEELHRNVVPHTQASPEKLNQYIQELSTKLTQNAGDLHQKIQRNLEQLKVKLSLYPVSLRERLAGAAEVQRQVEEFRRDTYLQIEDFTRVIDRETEEMKLKLSSQPSYLEEFQDSPVPMEDLHVRLDSLWKDISQSLSEQSADIQ
nr:PREDICTED: apolipoprotein A-IV-like [Apteryx mantelli mantelli]